VHNSCYRSARESGRRAAATDALAQRRGSHARLRRVCGWAAWRPGSCPRSAHKGGRRAAPTCAGWRAAPTNALAQRRGSCCGASAVGRRGAKILPSLYKRGWAARGSDLRPHTSSRLSTAAAAARLRLDSVAPRLLPSAREGGRRAALTYALGRRGPDLRSCTASRIVLLRRVRGWAAWRPGSCPCYAREGGQCAAPTKALAQRLCSTAAARPRLGGIAPDSCHRSAREEGGARLGCDRLVVGRGSWSRVVGRGSWVVGCGR